MRSEWAKSHARYQRWSEEVLLLAEEMRRVLVFLEWKAQWWLGEVPRRDNVRRDIADGINAYTHRQSELFRGLARSFLSLWYPIITGAGLQTSEWPQQYMEYGKAYPTKLRTYGGRRKKKVVVPAEQDSDEANSDSEEEDEGEAADGLSDDDANVSPYR